MTMEFKGGLVSGAAGNKPRIHVRAQDWGNHIGTDFWFNPYNVDVITASAPGLLTALGWVSNGTLSMVAETAGALFPTAEPTAIASLLCNATGETIRSPLVFGSLTHSHWIRNQLGWAPTHLIAEFYGQFTTSSNSEAASGFGFVKGALTTATNGAAVIASDGTNFRAKTTAADFTGALTGAAIDNNAHLFKIDMSTNGVFFYMDGLAIGTSMTLPTAVFPVAFAVGAGTSNVLQLGVTHVYYN